MIIKCKMCGGNLRPAENATTCECEYCGSVQTIPKLDNERRLNLYDRANHFRRNNEYDKAMGIFEQILQDDRTDAEAYWSLVLCRYGIEYVEDPASKKRIPTVNRAQFTSIYADEDYKSALQYADAVQKGIYETEAKAIDDIQKGILDISKKEKPFDVFICYKETDAEGKRTPDSVLANDLYHQLTREGFKVFFSRITLEDKLGQQYEPYIFAALNSAKVMVVLGTRPEHFNAVWVKNEWSRYLKLIRNGAEKTLVPAYKDMDPYDLPEEFSHLQAQDMSKLGFMQDLIHGIKKLTQKNEPEAAPQQVVVQTVAGGDGGNTVALLDRAIMALEDGEWDKADEFCEKVLNIDARNARAYLYKMMAQLKVRKEADLPYRNESFEGNNNYQKALRFADAKLKETLNGYVKTINDRNEEYRLKTEYYSIMTMLGSAGTVDEVQNVKNRLSKILAYKETADGIKKCDAKIEQINSDAYEKANRLMKNGAYVEAAAAFRALRGYRDAATAAKTCDEREKKRQRELAEAEAEKRRLEAEAKARREAEEKEKARIAAELKAREDEIKRREAEARRQKMNRMALVTFIVGVLAIMAFYGYTHILVPKQNYDRAVADIQNGRYNDAIQTLTELGDYNDAADRIVQAKADIAFDQGKYDDVVDYYATLPAEYQDHAGDFVKMYNAAVQQMNNGQYDEAIAAFTKLGKYSDSKSRITEATYLKADALAAAGDLQGAAVLYKGLNGYNDSQTILVQLGADMMFENGDYAGAWDVYATLDESYQTHNADYAAMYATAEKLLAEGQYDGAENVFAALGNYSNAADMVPECKYQKAASLAASGDYDSAVTIYTALNGYSDSKNLSAQATADKLYKQGSFAAAYDVYATLDEAYQTHKADYASMYAAAEQQLTEGQYDSAMTIFAALGNYSNASAMVPECKYQKAASLAAAGDYAGAIPIYAQLDEYSDSKNLLNQAIADNLYAKGSYAAAYDVYATLDEAYQTHDADYASMYAAAKQQLTEGQYDNAAAGFAALGSYSNAAEMVSESLYQKAGALSAAGDYAGAATIYAQLGEYRDSKNLSAQATADNLYAQGSYAAAYDVYAKLDEAYQTHSNDYAAMYAAANQQLTEGQYDSAVAIFTALGNYSNAAAMVPECKYQKAASLAAAGEYDGAVAIYTELDGYRDSNNLSAQASADKLFSQGSYAAAYDVYATLGKAYHTHADDYIALYDVAQTARTSGDYDNAYAQFAALGAFSDAVDKAVQSVIDKANRLIADEKYKEAAEAYSFIGDAENTHKTIYMYAGQLAAQGEYKQAADAYFTIKDYSDSREQHYQMGLQAYTNGKLADTYSILSEDADYRDAKETIYQTGMSASTQELYEVSVPCFTLVGAYKNAAMKLTMDTYAWGGQLYDNADYDKAAGVFASMGDFSDAATRANEARYAAAGVAMAAGQYDDAAARYAALNNYSDSVENEKAARYAAAKEQLKAGNYAEAKARFTALDNYSNSVDMSKECDYIPAKAIYEAKLYSDALIAFKPLTGYKDSDTILNDCRYQLGTEQLKQGNYSTALLRFEAAGSYSDAKTQANECRYQLALAMKNEGKYDAAIKAFNAIATYSDSKAQITACYNAIAAEHEAAGRYEAAYSQYQSAGNTTKAQEAAYQQALVKLSGSDYTKAIEWYEKAGTYSDAKEQILEIGEYYYATQQYDLAEAVYVKILTTGVAAQRLYELGQYYELVGNYQHAVKAYREAGSYQDAERKAVELQKEVDYQAAEALYAAKDWEGAKAAYAKIKGYKDVDSKIRTCDNEIAAAAAALEAKFTVGKYVTYGHYPQTKAGNDNTPIEWLVLARDGNKALLISRYALDRQPYNSKWVDMTWQKCSLRTWLNGTFLNKAFTSSEQKGIVTTNVDNSKSQGYSKWSTNGGNNTQDKVFLLSYAEAWKYFKDDNARMCAPTEYAVKQGVDTNKLYKVDGKGTCYWWLRSPGSSQNSAVYVRSEGSCSYDIVSGRSGNDVVRPALWVNLESGIF